MIDTHPLFADRPELDALAFAVVFALHKHLPEDKRPTSWSDFTEAQVLRAKEAAALAYDAGRESVKDLHIVMQCYERESDMPFEAYFDEAEAETRAKELNAGKLGACEYYRVDDVSVGRRPA